MNPRTMFLAALIAIPAALAVLLDAPEARGAGEAEKKLEEARKKGQALYRKSWKKGAKACFACHTRGANKLTGRRLKAYPKYDKTLKRVVTASEKINHMIKSKSGGKELPLGHEDLTALEAYISTLR